MNEQRDTKERPTPEVDAVHERWITLQQGYAEMRSLAISLTRERDEARSQRDALREAVAKALPHLRDYCEPPFLASIEEAYAESFERYALAKTEGRDG